MKNISKKLLSLFFAVAMLTLCACENKSTQNTSDIDPIVYKEEKYYNNGLHSFSKVITSDFISRANASDYCIVVPDKYASIVAAAAQEFVSLFEEATGIFLPIVQESNIQEGAKYISLGNTSLADEAGVQVDGRLNTHGYVIKTVGKNIYVRAAGDYGVMWGAYELLKQIVGYNCVAYDTWVFDENITDVPLYNLDIIDNPDFEIRVANNGIIYNDEAGAHRLRWLLPHKEVYLAPSTPYHNYFSFIPKSVYQEAHPKWYSDDGSQLCLTAHGDKQEYDALVKTMVDVIKREIDKDKNKKIITITQEDSNTWCKCAACTALYEEYGTDAASNIMFVNDVAEKVEKWLDDERGGREVLISIFAYLKTLNAPAVENSDGTYSPIDEKVVCRDNVAVLFAPIFANLVYGLEQPENISTYKILDSWSACCDKFGYWGYCTNYDQYLVPYNSFSAAQNIYRVLLDKFTPIWIFDQGQHDNGNHTGFTHFKMYLQSQWQWDVNRDFYQLKDTFFDAYFRGASDIMQKLYDEITTQLYYIQTEYNAGCGVFSSVLKPEYFPLQLLRQWMGYIDEAYASIENLRSDTALYNKISSHINLESISIRYMILKLYSGNLSSSEFQKMKAEFAADCRLLGVTRLGELKDIATFLES